VTIGGHNVARDTPEAFRKHITANGYRGDLSHKRRLLEKHNKGHKRTNQIGKMPIPVMPLATIGHLWRTCENKHQKQSNDFSFLSCV
jgi:translation elongation factor EF-4